MEITYNTPSDRQCASLKFSRKMLCDLANAVMDATG